MQFRYSRSQLDKLADYCANLSRIFFATFVLPIISGIEQFNIYIMAIGIMLGVLLLVTSLRIAQEYDREFASA